jgi:hypothetical protein
MNPSVGFKINTKIKSGIPNLINRFTKNLNLPDLLIDNCAKYPEIKKNIPNTKASRIAIKNVKTILVTTLPDLSS